MDLNREIDAVVARLSAGEEPRELLKAFAKAVRGPGQVTMEREVCKCAGCGAMDAICFKCKAVSLVGEQGIVAAPMLLAKLGPMITGWVAERKSKKAAAERAAASRAAQQAARSQTRRPPPPAGQQRF